MRSAVCASATNYSIPIIWSYAGDMRRQPGAKGLMERDDKCHGLLLTHYI